MNHKTSLIRWVLTLLGVFLLLYSASAQKRSFKADVDFGLTPADRYASKFSAKRSALRKLGAWEGGAPVSCLSVMRNGKPRRIVFINRK